MKKKPQYFSKIRFGIYSGVFTTLAIVTAIAIPIVIRDASAALNMVFNTSNYITITDEDEKGEIFYESSRDYLKGDKKYESGAAEKLYNDDKKDFKNRTSKLDKNTKKKKKDKKKCC